LASGNYYACLQRCRQILDQDACREDAFRMTMLCHMRLGQPARVRRWYELCVQTLRTHLDAEPEPATIELYAAATHPRAAAALTAT
jgi:DNA-binding SARP family transcriptional activator